MKNLPRISRCFLLFCALLPAASGAVEKARVNQPRVNVRGQASLSAEVVTQLQKDETVSVLEEITPANPKPGEPAKWAKIQMPSNTPVWVYAPYLKDRASAGRRMNLRAGPGENYSVVGRLEKGEAVKEIRSLDDWIEIETPATAYAFLDASLLTKSGETAPPPATAKPASPAFEQKAPPAPTPLTQQSLAETAPAPKALPPTRPVLEQPPVAPVTPAPATSQPLVPAATTASPAVALNKPVATVPAASAEPAPVVRRIVRREGAVRSTRLNIQAPTYFELMSEESGRGINYLQAEKSGIKLEEFRGKRVVVSGEEFIDPRYPSRPVLEIETIETAP